MSVLLIIRVENNSVADVSWKKGRVHDVMASLVDRTFLLQQTPPSTGMEPRGQQRITPCTPCEICQDN
jgi:hypothetical protein